MNESKRPQIIAFYAYKGGTGRSFSLAHTAWALAREGRRVVLIDMDLSAPSLWALFGRAPAAGLVEYLRAWSSRTPWAVRDLIEEIRLDPQASGAMYLLQAGRMDSDYLESLQTLDWHTLFDLQSLRPSPSHRLLFPLSTPFEDLFQELTTDLRPDAIIIDAPTGINDTANLCLRVLADLVVAVFAPVKVQLDGIGKVVSLLTHEQHLRKERFEPMRPDVFCVASTILLSRLAGSHIRRISDAFSYLNDVRFEAIGKPESPDLEEQGVIYQDAAVVHYDERLADLEALPTAEGADDSHFAVFKDVIDYVRGSLPPPRPRVRLAPSRKRPLLDSLDPCFELFAEFEKETFESLFLRTAHVDQVQNSFIVLVLGGKGSGKTALYSYLIAKQQAIPVHGPGVGLQSDVLCSLLNAAPDKDVFWRLYLLSALAERDRVLVQRELESEPIGVSEC